VLFASLNLLHSEAKCSFQMGLVKVCSFQMGSYVMDPIFWTQNQAVLR
jgi:hypothetical protein